MAPAPTPTIEPYIPRMTRTWDRDGAGDLWRQVDGSMALVDIAGFTSLSERLARHGRLGAEEITEMIDSCFSRLLADAYAYGGSLLKFGGDALLLFFTGDDHEMKAAAACLEMRRRLREIGRLETSAGGVKLRMSVGIHSGRFDFFMVGGSHRELIVAGPGATQVARIEKAAGTGEVLAGPSTVAALPAAHLGPARSSGRLLRGRFERADLHGFSMASQGLAPLDTFVPTALRAALGSGLEPEHRPVTVAFLQFGGIDEMIRGRGHAAAAEALDALIKDVQEAIDPRQVCFLGTDVSEDGGKIILTAGAPSATGDDEDRMLLALHEVVAAASALPIRCGVNRGHVFAGPVGPFFRRTYTVMGDAVNTAARLMADARPGQIVTTRDVLAGSRTIFQTTDIGQLRLKGKRDPVPAVRLGVIQGARTDVDASDLPLVGRDAEMAALMSAWEATAARGPVMVRVAGPAGVGKTRLLDEFERRVAPHRVMRGLCRMYQADTPYFAAQLVLRQMLGLDDDDRAASGRLATMVAERRPDLLPWLPLIAVPLGLEVDATREVDDLDGEFRTRRLETSVISLLETVVTDPCVVLVEDAQWMDTASADLLNALAASGIDRQWLVCAARRHDASAPLAPDEWHIDLEHLDQGASLELVGAASEANPLLPHVAADVAHRAGGNPLFILTLLRTLAEGRPIEALPDSIEALLMARIDHLPSDDRNVLRHVAVLGAAFDAAHADVVVDAGGRSALSRLGEFLDVDEEGWVSFRSALVRDVAYEGLPYRRRAQLHLQIAESVARSAATPESAAELLSVHYFHAKRYAEAWRYSRLAGDESMRVHANVAASTFYQRASVAAARAGDIADGERGAVFEALGDARDLAGLYEESRRAYGLARQLLKDRPLDVARLALKEAFLCERQGRFAQGLRWVRIGHRHLEGRTDPDALAARSKLTAWYSAIRAEQGRLREALSWARQGAEEARRGGDRQTLARAYLIIDYAQIGLGESTGPQHSHEALRIYEELDDLSGAANACNTLGAYAYFEGDWAGAQALYERAREAHERMGNPLSAALASANIAEILSDRGRPAEAEPMLQEARRAFAAGGDRWGVAFTERLLGVAASRQHRFDEADRWFDTARSELVAIGVAEGVLETDVRRIDSLVKRHDGEAALKLIESTLLETDTSMGLGAFDATIHRLRGEALVQVGDVPEGRTELLVAESAARAQDAAFELALTLDALTRLDVDQARSRTRRSRERDSILDRLGVEAIV